MSSTSDLLFGLKLTIWDTAEAILDCVKFNRAIVNTLTPNVANLALGQESSGATV